MFTVIFCSPFLVEDCHRKGTSFLSPLLNGKNYAFCVWNKNGKDLKEAAPDLENIVRGHKDWQAIIVLDGGYFGYDSINRLNPFDRVGSVPALPLDLNIFEDIDLDIFADGEKYDNEEIKALAEEAISKYDYEGSFQAVLDYRRQKEENYRAAVSDPVTRLCAYLIGCPVKEKPGVSANADKLYKKSDKEYFKYIIANYAEDDYIHPSVAEYECAMAGRAEFAMREFDEEPQIVNYPKRVMLFGERKKGFEELSNDNKRLNKLETEYSRFYEDNIYPNKLRYLLFDVDYVSKKRSSIDYLNFLTCLLILAEYGYPFDALRPNRVYLLEEKIDSDSLAQICANYKGKLSRTSAELLRRRENLSEIDKQYRIDDFTAESLFERDVYISTDLGEPNERNGLFAEHKIGLSKDCPKDESTYWDNQYREIKINFAHYLRAPRKAVKKAVKGPFRDKSFVSDERALILDEFQLSDVAYKIDDDELSMVKTKTTHIWSTEKWEQAMEKANECLKKELSYRMSKKVTVITAVILLVLYILGFVPYAFSTISDTQSSLTVLISTLVCILVFLGCGFVYLLINKRKTVRCFEQFNDVMKGILGSIDSSLGDFSDYLSYAASAKRALCALWYKENNETSNKRKIKLINKHIFDINHVIEEINVNFDEYLKESKAADTRDIYDYDFYVDETYDYPIPMSAGGNIISILQEGYTANIPVDYIVSMELKREELYD